MLSEEVTDIRERFKRTGLGLKEALAVMDLTLSDQMEEAEGMADFSLFRGLTKLIDRTARGCRIERYYPKSGNRLFHIFEVLTEEGESLGYLNMLYIKKTIPCYYLVYVEVLPPFRGRGLGNRILKAFKDFVESKGAIGILDNIIPQDHPTFDLYSRLGWKNVREYVGDSIVNGDNNYMIYVPEGAFQTDLKNHLLRILFNLKKRKTVIHARDNEDMVKRSIEEFRSVYESLLRLFDPEIISGEITPLMSFMFTKLVTKLMGFQKRITSLIGYTGGESLEQISLSDKITQLPIQPFSLWAIDGREHEIWGDRSLFDHLPEELKANPTLYIENLPLYKRPYLLSREPRREFEKPLDFRISDILSLGFDPTKLKEFHYQGVDYIFERSSPYFSHNLKEERKIFEKVAAAAKGVRFRGAFLETNPPLLLLQDKGNLYVLRKKLRGIHVQEGLDQLKGKSHLKELNRTARIDLAFAETIRSFKDWCTKGLADVSTETVEELTYFMPWNIEVNMPRICLDGTRVSFETIWIS